MRGWPEPAISLALPDAPVLTVHADSQSSRSPAPAPHCGTWATLLEARAPSSRGSAPTAASLSPSPELPLHPLAPKDRKTVGLPTDDSGRIFRTQPLVDHIFKVPLADAGGIFPFLLAVQPLLVGSRGGK